MAARAEPGRIRVAGVEELGYLIATDLATGRGEDALLGRPPETFNSEEAAAHANRIARFLGAIYTHTLERNAAVVELNLKLGYHIVRRGPIWDAAVRVSLIKTLT